MVDAVDKRDLVYMLKRYGFRTVLDTMAAVADGMADRKEECRGVEGGDLKVMAMNLRVDMY